LAGYYYCLVEGTYVVRQSRSNAGAEYLTPEGEWLEYPDLWDVATNGRPIESEEEALQTAKEIFERDPEWWAWQTQMRAGDEAYRLGDYEQAERLWRAWLHFEPNDPRLTRSLDSLAALYQAQGRYDEAESFSARALAIEEKALGPDHPALAERLDSYAALLEKMGRSAAATKMAGRAAVIGKPKAPSGDAQQMTVARLWRRLTRRRA
jgi:tetratricopeptide (TPR) repeat protein